MPFHGTALEQLDRRLAARINIQSHFMKYHFYRLVKYLRMQSRGKLQARIKGKWQTEW